MAAGYGVVFPRPMEFFFSNAQAILAKVGQQTIDYLAQLLGPTYLLLLSAFVFLRPFRCLEKETPRAGSPCCGWDDGPCFIIAFFHFVLPALVWATFDAIRFMLPCFAILVIPAVTAADYRIEKLGTRRARLTAWIIMLIVTAFFYANQWSQLYSRLESVKKRDGALQVAGIEFDRLVEKNAVVAGDDPFSLNYYFDRPTIILPQVADSAQRPPILERFLDQYRPHYILLTPEGTQTFSPLIAKGRLIAIGSLEAIGLQIFHVLSPARRRK